jgi:Domain of unknown function (DUF4335)
MPLSNSVMRRYTPPTCTLEVLAQSSPLSKWMNKSVLKQLRFELRFDDPRLPEEQRIAIRGDRDQLEALCAVVTTYVQEFLEKSPDQFWQSYSTSDTNKLLDGIEIQDNQNSSSRISTLGKPFNSQIPKADIYIEPKSHLSHNLVLGRLASPTTGAAIQLSLLQLFDLASACDEYTSDVMALPNLDTNQRRTRTSIPAWAPVAAVIAIGVGLAPITLQYANRARKLTATNQTSKQEIALQTPPPLDLTTPLILPTPQETLPLAGLPPAPLQGSSSNLQNPNLSTVPTLQTTSNPNLGQNTQVLPNSPTASGQIPPNLGNPGVSQSSSRFSFPTTPLPQSGSTFTIPGTVTPKFPATSGQKLPTLPNPGSIALQPNLSSSRTATQGKPGSNNQVGRLPSSSSFPPLADPSTLPANISALPPLGEVPKATTGIGNNAARTNVSSSNRSNNIPSQTTPPLTANNPPPLIDRLREARNAPNQVANASNNSATNTTIFDTPQVAEARNILLKRWQPPSTLKQTLEYSLVVGVDGTIERIMPLNRAARTYIDNTGMPLIGERFVSPNRNGQSVRIRAVFSPDGKVQTFPENE